MNHDWQGCVPSSVLHRRLQQDSIVIRKALTNGDEGCTRDGQSVHFRNDDGEKGQSRATNSDGDLNVTGQALQPVPLTTLDWGDGRFGWDSGVYCVLCIGSEDLILGCFVHRYLLDIPSRASEVSVGEDGSGRARSDEAERTLTAKASATLFHHAKQKRTPLVWSRTDRLGRPQGGCWRAWAEHVGCAGNKPAQGYRRDSPCADPPQERHSVYRHAPRAILPPQARPLQRPTRRTPRLLLVQGQRLARSRRPSPDESHRWRHQQIWTSVQIVSLFFLRFPSVHPSITPRAVGYRDPSFDCQNRRFACFTAAGSVCLSFDSYSALSTFTLHASRDSRSVASWRYLCFAPRVGVDLRSSPLVRIIGFLPIYLACC
ncbi:hypothetical protein VTN02DRAFT_4696 [Thermoascus thermophilus]